MNPAIFAHNVDLDITISQPLVDSANVQYVFLNVVWEAINPIFLKKRLAASIHKFRQQYPNAKIILILNSWYKPYDLRELGVDRIFHINFFLMQVYNRVFNIGQLDHCKSWDPSPDQFLFLTGKPHKLNRVRLLYLFKKAGLDDRMACSFFLLENTQDNCRKFFLDLSDREFNDFFNSVSTFTPDNAQVLWWGSSLHYSGIPFDHRMYQSSKFQVISETNFHQSTTQKNPCVTEKTWLPIINHRPFIIAADPGSLKKLKDMGFRTFDNYLPVDYDNILGHEQRLQAIVTNVKFWLDNIADSAADIKNDVDYNYQHFISMAKQNFQDLADVLDTVEPGIQPRDVIGFYDPYLTQRWREFYNNVRGDAWPECEYWEQVHMLPDHIKRQCLEKYQDFFGDKT